MAKDGIRRRLRRERDPEGRMSLGDHLRELRNRSLKAILAIFVGAGVGWWQYDRIFLALDKPIRDLAATRTQSTVTLALTDVTGAFSLRVSVSLFTGLLIASPVWLYQLWAFIVPGLTGKERRVTMLFIGASVPLFLGGCTFGFLTLPRVADALLGFTPDTAANILPADQYLDFVVRFVLAFGLAFLLPVFLVGLNAAGILPARIMLKAWRPSVFVIFLFAAVMTPTPDAWTMFALALPMICFFFGAIGISALLDRRRRKRSPASEWADVPDDQASPL